MAGRKSDFTLTRLDDLFTTQAQREEERLSKIRDIPLELIDDFPDHPFKVRDDEDMQQLVESIKERGVITPATVRQKEDGRYELISGHRRKRASELAGFDTLRCEVVDLNRDEATILMVESNFQRSQILPSEKAYVCDSDWTVREITPSEGYLLDKTVHKVGAEPKLFTIEHNLVSNDVTEQVMKGNIAIIKHTDDGETKIETPESGATFEIYLKSSGSFEAAEEDERDTVVCDENGFAQTKDMPYGVYTVHQTKGWEGREFMKDFDVFISQDGQTYRYLINNANFESYIKVVKVDAETGKTIPYAGAGFQIYDPAGNKVSMTFTYPTPTTIDTFYTDADGQLVTPEKLEYGKGYSLVEVQAPYGYVLDSTPVPFDVTEENSTQEGGITLIKVDKPNMAQKGTISVEKTGEVFFGVNVFGEKDKDVIYQPVYTVKGLAGAVYEITADEDIITPDGTLRYHKGDVVNTVTTDDEGFAKSKELYLGKYTVVEIKAPNGMVMLYVCVGLAPLIIFVVLT